MHDGHHRRAGLKHIVFLGTGAASFVDLAAAKRLGIKMVHIDPYMNHTAAHLGGKWISPKPGTDPALAPEVVLMRLRRLYLRARPDSQTMRDRPKVMVHRPNTATAANIQRPPFWRIG